MFSITTATLGYLEILSAKLVLTMKDHHRTVLPRQRLLSVFKKSEKKELSMLTALIFTAVRGVRTHFPHARGEPRRPAGGPCEPGHCPH